jgi:hypothetical protein
MHFYVFVFWNSMSRFCVPCSKVVLIFVFLFVPVQSSWPVLATNFETLFVISWFVLNIRSSAYCWSNDLPVSDLGTFSSLFFLLLMFLWHFFCEFILPWRWDWGTVLKAKPFHYVLNVMFVGWVQCHHPHTVVLWYRIAIIVKWPKLMYYHKYFDSTYVLTVWVRKVPPFLLFFSFNCIRVFVHLDQAFQLLQAAQWIFLHLHFFFFLFFAEFA